MNSTVVSAGFARSKVVRLATTSVLALAFASPALADCSPDPAPPFGTITCTGADADGITANANGVTINVDAGSSVAGIRAGTSPTPVVISVNNRGAIQSAVNESILGINTNLFGISNLTNAASGSIGAIRASVGFLNNDGLIDGGALSAVRVVINSVPASPAVVPQSLSNAGTIRSTADSRPTISYLNSNNSFYTIDNRGLIVNNGLSTAIQTLTQLGNVTINNAQGATIRSAGSTAIVGVGRLEIYNEGLIEASGDAIVFSSSSLPGGQFALTNNGIINGSIRVIESGGAIARTVIDTNNGIINGSVVLGSGDDILYTSPGKITGTVDGGTGTDTYQIEYLQNAVLSSAISTPTNFERLNFGLGNAVTLTLANGFALNSTLNIASPQFGGGSATVINNTNLVSTGPAIINSSTSPLLTFINAGSITSTLANLTEFGVRIENSVRFENSGTVTANVGGAVSLVAPISGATGQAINTGTIAADNFGLLSTRVNLTNSGTIRSNQGIAVALNNASASSNSGQIVGASTGVILTQATLVNTGNISSPFVGVRLNGSSTLDNRIGGIVTGGTAAIQDVTGTANNTVRNAGTINGNVVLSGTTGNSNNTYINFAGGILNGNLNLGSGGDRFVTALPTGGASPFAGIMGTVTGAGRETIVYMVDANANWVLGSQPAPFSAESYDLANNATLNLTAAAPQAYNTSISGWGSVNLTADLTNNTFGPILTVGATSPRFGATTSGGVNVTSNGTLTTTRSVLGTLAQPAVRVLGGTPASTGISSFTNAGTINVNDLVAGPGVLSAIAITGNGRATNSGTINLNGGVGVTGGPAVSGFEPGTGVPLYNVASLTNSGSIIQQAGGATARGVEFIGNVVNSGLISTAGVAVNLASTYNAGGLLDNSGTVRSTADVAVRATGFGSNFTSLNPVRVVNRSGGTISGGAGFDAISFDHFAVIDNAGTINGNVSIIGFRSSTYINRGGTLNGNLTFGSGNDTFISIGGTNGVTGAINAGAGRDTYAAGYTANATVAADGLALLASFERLGIGAVGADTTVTVTGPGAGLNNGFYFFGDGTVVNQATFNRGAFVGANAVQLAGLSGSINGLSFVNQGNIYDGIWGVVRSFENSGLIGLPGGTGTPVINLTAQSGDTFRFVNSGTIAPLFSPTGIPSGVGQIFVNMQPGQSTFQSASISNSGDIRAFANFNLNARDVTFLNSGSITGFDPTSPFNNGGVGLTIGDLTGQSANSALLANRVSFDNTGTLTEVELRALSRETIFSNSGTITGEPYFRNGVSIYVSPTLTGFILPAGASQSVAQFADQDNMRFTNSGNIGGTITIEGGVRVTDIVNSGTINLTAPIPSPFIATDGLALNVGIETVGSQTITLNNSGTISNSAIGGSAVGIGGAAGFAGNSPAGATTTINIINLGNILANGGAIMEPGSPPFVEVNTALAAVGASTGESNITITNAVGGLIQSYGIARTSSDPAAPSAGFAAGDGSVAIIGSANRIAFTNAGTVTGGAGFTIPVGSEIDLEAELIDATDPDDEYELADLLVDSYLPGAVLFFNSIDTVLNTGTINGSVDLGAFDDRMSNYGAMNGNVFLRSGNDAFLQGLAGSLVGTVDGGIGTDALTIDTTGGIGAAFDMTRFVNFESLLVNGSGSVGLSGALAYDTINLSRAGIVVTAGQTLSTTGPVTITGTAGNERLANDGAIAGSVLLGDGDDSVVNAGTIGGTLDLGEGNNVVANNIGGVLSNAVLFGSGNDSLTNSGQIDVAINLGEGSNNVTNSGTLASTLTFGAGDDGLSNSGTIAGLVDMGAGVGYATNSGLLTSGIRFADANDTLINSGTINGMLLLAGGDDGLQNSGQINALADLGTGNNVLANLAGGVVTAGVLAGSGNDQLQNAGTIGGMVDLGDGNNQLTNNATGILADVSAGSGNDTVSNLGRIGSLALGNGINQISNSGTITGAVTSGGGDDLLVNSGTMAAVSLGAGRDVINNTGTIGGAVSTGDDDDTILNFGRLTGAVDMGGGADMFVLRSGSAATTVSGGAGTNQVTMILAGTETAPDQLDLSGFTGFEALRHESGVGLLSNSANFGLIDIIAGRLIGAAGSTITSNTIMVARGATFGSAGTVIGNIVVNGTLSPGASPGTMTVNGNVGFNQGSTALFELTPTTTDRLVVNGAVVIASGATLNLTGNRPITPGTPLDLITATGGISGSFGTIVKSADIFGFTRMQGGSLQLLGLFAVEPTFNPQITTIVNYVNSVLQSPQTPAGLATALPALANANGSTNTAAFSQLHPEPFASASQIGIENGLALAKALRASQFGTEGGDAKLFAFGQGFGNWRELAADADRGTSRADISSYGVLGGVGYGSSNASISVFTGYLDAKQDINALGSTTKADGIFAGVSGRIASNGFHASAMLAYDGSSASTTRALFNSTMATSKYKLRGWTIDVDGGYDIPLSDAWSAGARVGVTHINSRRGDLSETGGTPFDLDVLARKTKATFADGELVLSGGQAVDAKIRPWVSAGVRHQLSGNAIVATGGFKGLSQTFTVTGAERSETLPIFGAGAELIVDDGVSLFADYHGEFGKGTEGQNVNVGVRIRF